MLETRLASITHYTNLIMDCQEVIKTTDSTRRDILLSLIEFFPIKQGHIIYFRGRVMRVDGIDTNSIQQVGQTFHLKIYVSYSNSRGEWAGNDWHYITHEDAMKVKIINLEEVPTE